MRARIKIEKELCIVLNKKPFSIFAKTFEKILDNRIRAWSERVGTLCDFEVSSGFSADRSTVDQIFTLKEILSFIKSSEKTLFVAFLDVKKAYLFSTFSFHTMDPTLNCYYYFPVCYCQEIGAFREPSLTVCKLIPELKFF